MVHHLPQENLPGLPEELKPKVCDICRRRILPKEKYFADPTLSLLPGGQDGGWVHQECHKQSIKSIEI